MKKIYEINNQNEKLSMENNIMKLEMDSQKHTQMRQN